MTEFIGSVWWMVVSIGILVTIHEFGHYWVARRCGIKVLRFSVGFGKPLFLRRDRHGTEFVIAAIPLGGYVSMLDERDSDVPLGQRAQAYNNKTVWQRIAVVAAGPAANLILCLLLLWAMFVIGRQDYSATVGRATELAAAAGLQPGDRIISVDGRPIATWGDASIALTKAAMDRSDPALDIVAVDGTEERHVLPLSRLPEGFDERRVAQLAGLQWQFTVHPAIVERVEAGSPAEGILLPGDRVLAVDGHLITGIDQVIEEVQRLGRQGGPGMVEVERAGERLALELTPRLQPATASVPARWLLDVRFETDMVAAYDAKQQYGPFAAVPAAIRQTGQMASDSLGLMRRMLTGHASVQNISGPVTIARAANASADRGLDWFLYFLAVVSLSLCIINLLPIPILDGGRLLYYLIELVKGSPLSERAIAASQFIGVALLAGLMGLAFYNDILSLVPR